MAKNLYKTAFTASSSQGKYRASMYDVASSDELQRLENARLQFDQDSLNKNVSFVADTLSLASTVAGRYEDLSGDISLLEEKYGEMERPDSMFGKLMQSTKIGLGLGDYKFGDETISARDIAVRGSQIKYKSMLDEAMSDISPLTNVNVSRNLPKSNTDVDIEGDVELEPLDFGEDINPFEDPNTSYLDRMLNPAIKYGRSRT
jgi:hypothetical protein